MLAYLVDERAQGVEFLEVFAGRARTARLASARGMKARAVDMKYSDSMNLLKPAGFLFLVFFGLS